MSKLVVSCISFIAIFLLIFLLGEKKSKAKAVFAVVVSACLAPVCLLLVSGYLWRTAPKEETVVYREELLKVMLPGGQSRYLFIVGELPDQQLGKAHYAFFLKGGVCLFPSEKMLCLEEDRTDAVIEEYDYRYIGRFKNFTMPVGIVRHTVRVPRGTIGHQTKIQNFSEE